MATPADALQPTAPLPSPLALGVGAHALGVQHAPQNARLSSTARLRGTRLVVPVLVQALGVGGHALGAPQAPHGPPRQVVLQVRGRARVGQVHPLRAPVRRRHHRPVALEAAAADVHLRGNLQGCAPGQG